MSCYYFFSASGFVNKFSYTMTVSSRSIQFQILYFRRLMLVQCEQKGRRCRQGQNKRRSCVALLLAF